MPTYEYGCPKCSHEFEAEQRITDEPIKCCPNCRSRKVKRLISRTSFVLKGGGWYSDLYSSGGAKKSGDSGDAGAGDSKSEPASETKSDAKPDTKSDTKSEAPKSDGSGGDGSKPKSKSASKAKQKAA